MGIDLGIKCIINMCSAISSYNFYDFLGQRDFITAVDTGDNLKDKENRKRHIFSISNAEYQ